MINKILMAIVVGVITGIVVYIIGLVLIEVHIERIGEFVKGLSGLLGLLAGIYYYVAGRRAV